MAYKVALPELMAEQVKTKTYRMPERLTDKLPAEIDAVKLPTLSSLVSLGIETYFTLREWYDDKPDDTTNPLHSFFSARLAGLANTEK